MFYDFFKKLYQLEFISNEQDLSEAGWKEFLIFIEWLDNSPELHRQSMAHFEVQEEGSYTRIKFPKAIEALKAEIDKLDASDPRDEK